MNQIYPDQGVSEILLRAVAGGLQYHLYRNDFLPTLDSALTDFVEAAWSGYVPILVPDGSWALGVVVSHVAQITAPDIHFPNTSGSDQVVYGYFITDAAGVKLVGCARFDNAPITIPNAGSLPVHCLLANYSGLAV